VVHRECEDALVVEANTEQLDTLLDVARRATREKEPAAAIEACEQALEIAPGDTRFVFMLGAALRRSGEYEKAMSPLRDIVEAAPGLPVAHQELGLNYLSLGQLHDARQSLEKAVDLDPSLVGAWRTLSSVRTAEGDDVGAAEAYRRSLGTDKLDPALRKALELFGAGRLGVAEGICREYLRQRPLDVDAIRLLAEIGIRLGIIDEAIKLLERCLELAPEFHVARANYATALGRKQRFDEALTELERLEKSDPDNVSYQVQRASVMSMAGRFEDAHEKFRQVLARVPGNARILTSYGHSLRYGGKGDEAIDAYQQAIAADPEVGEAYWSLANLKTFRFSDDQVDGMKTRLQSLEKPSADKYHLAFALGKALEDGEQYDESFAAYAAGNAIKREFSAYDRKDTTSRVDAMIEHCSPALFDTPGHPSNEPIFVVGLPRAGSTLIEQILASHSEVEATAELPFIGEIAGELSEKRKKSDESRYPAVLSELTRERREALGQQYLDRAAIYRTGAPRFIDKLPNNWLHVALIKTILPNATIIDARREPMAAGFANFKQLFARGQEFTYSLGDIGHYYADYLRLMAHAGTILPGAVLTVEYEDVVEDLETQVNALLEHCDLPFEEACVRYYEKDRAVRTASSEQVRQPIYRDALTLWQRYEPHLEPLAEVYAERGVKEIARSE
jgi:tetratricopeptide (TPR) repeat protein